MSLPEVIEAELCWTGEAFERAVRIAVDADGLIEAMGDLDREPTRHLPSRALLPGLVNAHSHAFQRGLRGVGETYAEGPGSFWSWREGMYALVGGMDAGLIRELSRRAFEEMRDAGITTVGEFHYLHGEEEDSFGRAVLGAARDAGIRIVCLLTYYQTGAIGAPLEGPQRRFASASPAAYWDRFDRLAAELDPATQELGVAVHSIRAASLDDLASVHAEASRRGLVFHMHLEEQEREIADCVAAHGATPMALVNERLEVSDRFCAVHCTHTARADLEPFLAAGGSICICPLTEASLADGIADLSAMREHGASLSLGTDSNSRLSMTEEMRWLEFAQRLKLQRRGACTDSRGRVASALLEIATTGGALALGLESGRIEAGAPADLLAIDLDCPSLAGWTDDTLLPGLILGSGNEAIAATAVAGRWRSA